MNIVSRSIHLAVKSGKYKTAGSGITIVPHFLALRAAIGFRRDSFYAIRIIQTILHKLPSTQLLYLGQFWTLAFFLFCSYASHAVHHVLEKDALRPSHSRSSKVGRPSQFELNPDGRHAMAIFINGHANGHNGTWPHLTSSIHTRFSDIPSALDIPVAGADAEEAVEVDLELLPDDPTELCTLLENENAAKNIWMVVSLAYGRQHKINLAIEILNRGLHSLSRGSSKEKIGLLSLLCWLYLWKSREAPRVAPNGQLVSEAKTKDFYLQAATGALNEASRVNPSFPPLFLARGILSLLRASLQPPSKNLAPGVVEQSERMDTLRQALKCFDDASRVSAGRNMMAILGKARTLFSLARYAEALDCYQDVLNKMPDLRDPDPRIGIGCCLWRLSHHEEAKEAWDRALELVRHPA